MVISLVLLRRALAVLGRRLARLDIRSPMVLHKAQASSRRVRMDRALGIYLSTRILWQLVLGSQVLMGMGTVDTDQVLMVWENFHYPHLRA